MRLLLSSVCVPFVKVATAILDYLDLRAGAPNLAAWKCGVIRERALIRSGAAGAPGPDGHGPCDSRRLVPRYPRDTRLT